VTDVAVPSGAPDAAPDGRGFLFDLNRCTGCHACELACATENGLEWGTSWRQVVTFNEDRLPSIPTYHLSLACNHCRDAPCRRHCPALAIDRDPATGAVLIDDAKCIGCAYCSWACPYDAPRFDAGAGVMRKCTWCRPRLAEGREPACVEQCPTGALGFGTLAGETAVPGFPDTPARPAIRFTPLRNDRRVPETTWEPPPDLEAFAASRPVRGPVIALGTEWPLCLFTLLVSALAGWVLGTLGGAAPAPLPAFLGAAGLAAAASTLHLGRRDRLWRAVLNIRGSWLSREIVFFGAFSAVTVLHLLVPDLPGAGLAAAALGAATLVSIDRVYDLVRPSGSRLHSADTVLTGALVACLSGNLAVGAAVLAGAKLVLYAAGTRRNPGGPGAWVLHAVRIAGLVAAGTVFASGPASAGTWILLAAAEVIDRVRFYRGLRVPSPHRQTAADLARARAR
jgi:DMSO reductase iron-sulfur subunit